MCGISPCTTWVLSDVGIFPVLGSGTACGVQATTSRYPAFSWCMWPGRAAGLLTAHLWLHGGEWRMLLELHRLEAVSLGKDRNPGGGPRQRLVCAVFLLLLT